MGDQRKRKKKGKGIKKIQRGNAKKTKRIGQVQLWQKQEGKKKLRSGGKNSEKKRTRQRNMETVKARDED